MHWIPKIWQSLCHVIRAWSIADLSLFAALLSLVPVGGSFPRFPKLETPRFSRRSKAVVGLMGYYIETTRNQSFFISKNDFQRCYQAMCALNTTHDHLKRGSSTGGIINSRFFSWMSADYPSTCKTMQQIFDELGFTCSFDDQGHLCRLEYDNKSGQQELFLDACNPWIRKGSFIEWRGEEGEVWRKHYGKKRDGSPAGAAGDDEVEPPPVEYLKKGHTEAMMDEILRAPCPTCHQSLPERQGLWGEIDQWVSQARFMYDTDIVVEKRTLDAARDIALETFEHRCFTKLANHLTAHKLCPELSPDGMTHMIRSRSLQSVVDALARCDKCQPFHPERFSDLCWFETSFPGCRCKSSNGDCGHRGFHMRYYPSGDSSEVGGGARERCAEEERAERALSWKNYRRDVLAAFLKYMRVLNNFRSSSDASFRGMKEEFIGAEAEQGRLTRAMLGDVGGATQQPPCSPSNAPALRFAVGDAVECRCEGGWRAGRVVQTRYRERGWPPGETAPYQVRLERSIGGHDLIFVPEDSAAYCRPRAAPAASAQPAAPQGTGGPGKQCAQCGGGGPFSKTQLGKGSQRRCVACVARGADAGRDQGPESGTATSHAAGERDGPPALEPEVSVGARVEAWGLQGAARLNGRQGEVVKGRDAGTGRVGVRFAGEAAAVAIKPGNLRVLAEGGGGEGGAEGGEEGRRRVMLLALEKEGFFEDMFGELLEWLEAEAEVFTCESEGQAIDSLRRGNLAAVLVTDAGVLRHARVRPLLGAFARERGGTVVFCGHFSGFARVDQIGPMFQSVFGLAWAAGDYARAEFALAPSSPLAAALPASCNAKALMLQSVPEHQAVYLAAPHSRTQSSVFAARAVSPGAAAAAYARVGAGWVGYVGDVNAEEESSEVVVEMCLAAQTASAAAPTAPEERCPPTAAAPQGRAAAKRDVVEPFFRALRASYSPAAGAGKEELRRHRQWRAYFDAEVEAIRSTPPGASVRPAYAGELARLGGRAVPFPPGGKQATERSMMRESDLGEQDLLKLHALASAHADDAALAEMEAVVPQNLMHNRGFCWLHNYSRAGRAEAVRCLLDRGADPSCTEAPLPPGVERFYGRPSTPLDIVLRELDSMDRPHAGSHEPFDPARRSQLTKVGRLLKERGGKATLKAADLEQGDRELGRALREMGMGFGAAGQRRTRGKARCCFHLQQKCKHGSRCRFSHSRRGGPCNFGAGCYFLHCLEDEEEEPASGSDEDAGGMGGFASRMGGMGRARTGFGAGYGGFGFGGDSDEWSDEGSEYDDEDEFGGMFGFSGSEVQELLAQGVKPWDEDAADVLAVLNGDF